jgi:integrase
VEADLVRGTYVDPRAGRLTFRDYAERWREIQVHRPTTRAQVETHLRKHVYPMLGDRQIGAIRRSDIQGWVRRLEAGAADQRVMAAATIETMYRHVVAIFRAAVADRIIPSSPCVHIKLPKIEPKRIEPISTELVGALAAGMPSRLAALVALGAGTGLRQGEAFGLEVEHVDFLRRTLRVEQQVVLLAGEEPKIARPKTDASYRDIPLPRVVVDALAAHLAEFPAVPFEVEDTRGTQPVRRLARLVFASEEGEPLRRTNFSARAWRPARASAGAPDWVTYHDLRHYYASLLIRHGESVKVVQRRLGHATATETLDTYSHLWPDSEDRTREAVDKVLGASDDAAPEAMGEGTSEGTS